MTKHQNLINIVLLKESLNSNGQQFYQHQLNKKSPLISPVCIYATGNRVIYLTLYA